MDGSRHGRGQKRREGEKSSRGAMAVIYAFSFPSDEGWEVRLDFKDKEGL